MRMWQLPRARPVQFCATYMYLVSCDTLWYCYQSVYRYLITTGFSFRVIWNKPCILAYVTDMKNGVTFIFVAQHRHRDYINSSKVTGLFVVEGKVCHLSGRMSNIIRLKLVSRIQLTKWSCTNTKLWEQMLISWFLGSVDSGTGLDTRCEELMTAFNYTRYNDQGTLQSRFGGTTSSSNL